MLRGVVLIGWLVGCYSPQPAVGVPCGPGGACPSGQTCGADDRCGDDRGDLDAAFDDASPEPDALGTDAPPAAVAPTVRGVAMADGTTTRTRIAAPDGTVAGDLVIAHLNADGTRASQIDAPPSWVRITPNPTQTAFASVLLVHFATAADEQYEFTFPNTANNVHLVTVTNVSTTDPLDGVDTRSGSADLPPTAPSLTTVRPDTLLLTFFARDLVPAPMDAPTSMTLVYQQYTGELSVMAASDPRPTAGPTGARTAVTANEDGPWVTYAVAIAPP